MAHIRCCTLVTVLLLAVLPAMGAATYGPNNLPPFVHPPVLKPIPDGIKLEVPKELGMPRIAHG